MTDHATSSTLQKKVFICWVLFVWFGFVRWVGFGLVGFEFACLGLVLFVSFEFCLDFVCFVGFRFVCWVWFCSFVRVWFCSLDFGLFCFACVFLVWGGTLQHGGEHMRAERRRTWCFTSFFSPSTSGSCRGCLVLLGWRFLFGCVVCLF